MILLGKFKISGHSMEPTIHEGDEILVSTFLRVKKGDVVAFRHNAKVLVKRVKNIKGDLYELRGDNMRDSLDSKQFGEVSKNDIIGKVIWKL